MKSKINLNLNFKKAQVIALVLLLIAISSILTVTAFTQVSRFRNFGKRSIEKELALNLAEAGIDRALWKMNESPAYTGDPTPVALGQGELKVTISGVAGSASKKITADGCIPTCSNARVKRVA